jgi:hypothetical protein
MEINPTRKSNLNEKYYYKQINEPNMNNIF